MKVSLAKGRPFLHAAGRARIEWSMKRRIFETVRRGICLLLSMLILVGGVRVYASGKADAPTLTVRRAGEYLWTLEVSPGLGELTAGDPMALLLEVTPPDGWRITQVTVGKGAEGLILTRGETKDERVRILLDGVCTGKENETILRIFVEKIPNIPPKKGGYMGVTGGIGEAIAVYALREGAAAEVIPLALVWEAGYEEPAETEEAKTEVETEEDPFLETETEEIPAGEEEAFGMFIGCRETAVVAGTYTVQLLFSGDDPPPMLYARGGGVIYAAWEAAEDVDTPGGEEVLACTLRGLWADRDYVFWIRRGEDWVGITYTEGAFGGFETVDG